MAITRARLPFHVPWRRGSDDPVPLDTAPAPVAPASASHPLAPAPGLAPLALATEPAAVQATTPGRDRSPSRRGPDGRFMRRADPSSEGPAPAAAMYAPEAPAVPLPVALAAPVEASHVALEPARRADDSGETPAPSHADPPSMTELRPVDTGRVEDVLASPRAIRVVLVEDVPDVVAHVKEILRSQSRFQLIQVIQDGRRAVEQIQDLHPDVVLVDSLLQGRTSGRNVVEGLRAGGSPIGIIALTVPDYPVDTAMSKHADVVLTLPLRTYDLGRGIIDAHTASAARDPLSSSRIVTVFSAKGGVGKTTIAYNLAASLATSGLRTLLLDGSLQFGDVRRLLRADPTAPSICDLPTDGVRGSDLADSVVRDASGTDVLLAPPRPELAELVNGRDLEQLLGILRRAYQAIIIDTPSSLNGPTLSFLDAADLILHVMTADAAALELAPMIAATFAELGYPAAKVRYLVNRFDAVGAVPAPQVVRAIGRTPDYTVASDWHLVSSSNAEGIPYVLAGPAAAASVDLRRVAEHIRALAVAPAAAVPVRRAVWHR